MLPLRISVGSLVAEVEGVDFDLNDDRVVLARFATQEPADFSVSVRAGDLPRKAWGKSVRLSESVDAASRTVFVSQSEFSARFDLVGRTVSAELAGRWPGAVDSLLKTAVQLFAVETRTALFFHASAVQRGGEAYVFVGRASSGKTTAAILSREAGGNILNEEIVCIGGLDGRRPLRVHTVCLRERNHLVGGPMSVPLRRIYGLHHASRDAIEHIAADRQIRLLASTATIGVRDPMLMMPALDLAVEIRSACAGAPATLPQVTRILGSHTRRRWGRRR